LWTLCSSIDIDPGSHLYQFPFHEPFFNFISDCDVDQSVVEKHGFVLVMVPQLILVLFGTNEATVLLPSLHSNYSLQIYVWALTILLLLSIFFKV
jgi:hypothetical protein